MNKMNMKSKMPKKMGAKMYKGKVTKKPNKLVAKKKMATKRGGKAR